MANKYAGTQTEKNLMAALAGVDSVEHGAYQDADSLAAMASCGTVWVPTLSTIGNLRGKGRFDECAVAAILESALENVAKFFEDYKNYSERYELYTNQRNDLMEAEASLIKIIEQLDDEMRKLFKEKFASIGKQFDLVFRELFGGGQGTLELIEDADILTAGIRIIAQPPGKKLQNMMQLSGGEKALTAIALLFAIQNLKPSPFALLDEIEAALDDSTVGRFAKY